MALSLNKQMRFLQKRRENPVLYTFSLFFPLCITIGRTWKTGKDCFFERHEKVWQRNLYMSAREMRRWERERCCAFLGQAKWRSSLKMNEDGGERNVSSAVSMSRKGNIRLPWCSIILEKEELLGADAFIQYIMFPVIYIQLVWISGLLSTSIYFFFFFFLWWR